MLLSDDVINRNDPAEDSNLGSVFRESVPEAWIIRAKPKDEEVIRIYPAWLKWVFSFLITRLSCLATFVLCSLALFTLVIEAAELLSESVVSFSVFQDSSVHLFEWVACIIFISIPGNSWVSLHAWNMQCHLCSSVLMCLVRKMQLYINYICKRMMTYKSLEKLMDFFRRNVK